jgi:hypothetical protein
MARVEVRHVSYRDDGVMVFHGVRAQLEGPTREEVRRLPEAFDTLYIFDNEGEEIARFSMSLFRYRIVADDRLEKAEDEIEEANAKFKS